MNLTLIVTQNCNMDCSYCFEKQKNRAVSMSDDVLRRTLDHIMEEYLKNSSEPISINFCGGEPLLMFDKIRYFIEQIELKSAAEKLAPVSYEISTNAILIESKMIDYLKQHDVSYYIGFDGVKKSFDRNRKFYNNQKGGFEIAYGNIKKMLGEGVRPEQITLNLVITDNNVEYLTDNVFFINNIASGIKFSININYNCKWQRKSLGILNEKLGGLIDFYKDRILENNKYSIKFIDDRIKRLLYRRKVKPSEQCGAANGCLTVLADGNIIGCATLAYCRENNDEIILGNVSEGINPLKKGSFRDSIDAIDHDECEQCGFWGICNNYCVANNLIGSGKMTEVSRNICETEKIIIYKCNDLVGSLKHDRPDILMSRYGYKVRQN